MTGGSFTIAHHKKARAHFDISLFDCQKLARPCSAVAHHNDGFGPVGERVSVIIGNFANSIELAHIKRLLDVFRLVLIYIDKAADVVSNADNSVFDGKFIHVMEKLAHFLLRWLTNAAF